MNTTAWKPIDTWDGELYKYYFVCDKDDDSYYVAHRGKNGWYDVDEYGLECQPDFWLDIEIPVIPKN